MGWRRRIQKRALLAEFVHKLPYERTESPGDSISCHTSTLIWRSMVQLIDLFIVSAFNPKLKNTLRDRKKVCTKS